MLKPIRELGKYLRDNKNLNQLQILTESSKLKNTKKMICVVFSKEEEGLAFDNVYIEDFDQEKAEKILYRTFRHARYDATLTAKITKPDMIEKRWTLWFGKYFEKFKDVFPELDSLKEAVESNKDKLIEEISEKYTSLDKTEKRGCLVTIKIKEGRNEKYLADIPEFIEIFKTTSMEDFYYKHKVESIGEGTCCLCMKNEKVIPASPFPVFTVDKEGFAYGFDRANSWKQLPICIECTLDLQAGKGFLKNKLSFILYGYQYFVIPHFIFKEISSEIIDEIEYRGRKDYRNGLLNAEEDILEEMKEKGDILNLIFVFCKPKQQFFDIIRYSEDVSPSWIKKMYDDFDATNRKMIFKQKNLKVILGDKWSEGFRKGQWAGKSIKNLNLSGIVKTFFPTNFIDILGNILDQEKMHDYYLLSSLIKPIREQHGQGNEWSEKLLTLKSFYLFNFLLDLNLVHTSHFKSKQCKEMNFMKETKYRRLEEFFNEFQNAFDTSDKKAIFLEGVLVNFLLSVQYAQRGSTPFRKKLYGLKLDKRKIKRLLPVIIEKFRAYNTAYPNLEALISKYFVEADENGWKVSDNELGYYFALGLNLGKFFKGGDKLE